MINEQQLEIEKRGIEVQIEQSITLFSQITKTIIDSITIDYHPVTGYKVSVNIRGDND